MRLYKLGDFKEKENPNSVFYFEILFVTSGT